MDDQKDLTGRFAQLPDGQKVVVLSVDGDPPWATTRRVGGQHDGVRAVILVSKLEPFDSEDSTGEETE